MRMEFGPGTETWSEKDFQRAVVKDLAGFFGYTRVVHFRYTESLEKGWPDLMLFRGQSDRWPAATVALELKAGKGVPTKIQVEWLKDMRRAGTPAFLIHVTDLDALQSILADPGYFITTGWDGAVAPSLEANLYFDQYTGKVNRS